MNFKDCPVKALACWVSRSTECPDNQLLPASETCLSRDPGSAARVGSQQQPNFSPSASSWGAMLVLKWLSPGSEHICCHIYLQSHKRKGRKHQPLPFLWIWAYFGHIFDWQWCSALLLGCHLQKHFLPCSSPILPDLSSGSWSQRH